LAGEFWTPRYALLPLEALVGLCLVLTLLRTSLRAPAALGIGFATWAVLSTALSPDPLMAVWGEWLWGTGLVFALALVGMWGIGALAGSRGAQLIENGLVLAAVINAVLALVETLFDLTSIDLGPFAGRAVGLWGNPVWLGGFLVGALWIVCARFEHHRRAGWAAIVVVIAGGVQVSGSRSALAVTALIGLVVLVRNKPRVGLRILAWILVGLALGFACTAVANRPAATSRATGDAAGGTAARLESWRGAAHAVARRPLVGEGPGRYEAAAGPYRTLKLARDRGPERLFLDAHNFVVEYATTMGIPGLLLLLAFIVVALWRAGPLSAMGGFALAVLAVHLLEPQNPGLTPLVFLALGAGVASDALTLPRIARPAVIVFGAFAGIAAAVLLVGTWHWERGDNQRSLQDAKQARQILPHWPETAKLVAADIQGHAAPGQQAAVAATTAARGWIKQAVVDDPRDESSWSLLGAYDVLLGDPSAAGNDFRRALALNPWSTTALNGMGAVAARSGDNKQARYWWDRSLLVLPGQTDVIQAEHGLSG
jgi:O-antigen ligase